MNLRAGISALAIFCLVAAGGQASLRPGLALVLILFGAVSLGFIVAALEREAETLRQQVRDPVRPDAEVLCPKGYTPLLLGALAEQDMPLYLADMKPVTRTTIARYQDQRVLILSHE